MLKNKDQTEKKNGTKKQKTALPGVEPGLSARASNSLTTAPHAVTHMIRNISFVIAELHASAKRAWAEPHS